MEGIWEITDTAIALVERLWLLISLAGGLFTGLGAWMFEHVPISFSIAAGLVVLAALTSFWNTISFRKRLTPALTHMGLLPNPDPVFILSNSLQWATHFKRWEPKTSSEFASWEIQAQQWSDWNKQQIETIEPGRWALLDAELESAQRNNWKERHSIHLQNLEKVTEVLKRMLKERL